MFKTFLIALVLVGGFENPPLLAAPVSPLVEAVKSGNREAALALVAKRVESATTKPGQSEGEKKAKKPSQAARAAGSKAGSSKRDTT